MNRTVARIALTASAVVVGGAALAPAATAASAYPPVTPPGTVTTVPAVPAEAPCTPVDGQVPNSQAPAGRASSPEVLASNLPWWCTPVAQTSASRTVDSLAYTGAEVGTVAAAGLGLVVAGGLLVRSGRRTPVVSA